MVEYLRRRQTLGGWTLDWLAQAVHERLLLLDIFPPNSNCRAVMQVSNWCLLAEKYKGIHLCDTKACYCCADPSILSNRCQQLYLRRIRKGCYTLTTHHKQSNHDRCWAPSQNSSLAHILFSLMHLSLSCFYFPLFVSAAGRGQWLNVMQIF